MPRPRREFYARFPRLCLQASARIGRARYRLGLAQAGRDYSPRDHWEKLLGPIGARECRRIQRLQSGHTRSTRLLERILKREGCCGFRSLYEWKDARYILDPLSEGKPVIAGSWHVGPLFSFALALAGLERPLTLLVHQPIPGDFPSNWDLIFTGQGRAATVEAFKQSAARLRSGGLVAMALDNFTTEEDGAPGRCFGMDLRLKRGFAAMARASRARVVPVALRWLPDGRLRFEAQPPLETTLRAPEDREEFELAVVREFGDRLDAYMRAHPEDLDPGRVARFVNAWNRLNGLPHEPPGPGRG